MNENRTSTNANRLGVGRRAKRGLVAGYIRELSQRRKTAREQRPERPAAGPQDSALRA